MMLQSHGNTALQLVLLRKLLENTETLLCPTQGLRLHGGAILVDHTLQAVELLGQLVQALGLPLLNEALLLVRAAAAVGLLHIAQAGAASLLNVLLHVVFLGAKLVTHRLGRLLLVRFATVAGGLVEVADRRPAAGTRALRRPVDGAHLVLRQ
eukprot:SRR837773.19440.p1 GENE.SRR837773.19440~~SRR837773.19440.p1  ORF type:complete len:153 (+),score=36.25 SRR837773.19440:1-459(+)